MIRELISTFRKGMYERISNPLIVSFVVAWFAWNWRGPVLLFLSEAPVEDRIAQIGELSTSWCQLVVLPATAAAFYSLLMPWILHLVLTCRNAAYRRMKCQRLTTEKNLMTDRKSLQVARVDHDLLPERQRRQLEDEFAQSKHNRDSELLEVRERDLKRRQDALDAERMRLESMEMALRSSDTRYKALEFEFNALTSENRELKNQIHEKPKST